MRRILASAASFALALGLMVGVSPLAYAVASPGTVTVGGTTPSPTTLTSSTVQAEIGDTFILRSEPVTGPGFYVANLTGSVSDGMTNCATTSACIVNGGNSITLTVRAFGTLDIKAFGLANATLTITSGSSGGGGREDLVNRSYTATVDANGGSCTGTTSWQRIDNDAAFPGVFTLPSANDCTRPNYTLAGWASTANATTVQFAPLRPYLMGNSNVTLYAVWRPNGVEVVYDANVGLDTECIAGGTNLTTAAERRSKATVVAVGSATATAAPCSPAGQTLSGWSLTGDGASVAAPGAALPASLTSGTSVTLYAKWSIPVARTIVIEGERTTVSGKPGIIVDGETEGFVAGARVVPYIRFPGQTGYTAGSARPEIGADGSFSWQRKTGKKTYVYFTSEDGNVFSNRVIIPAS